MATTIKVCEFCDAGDPTSFERYHTPDQCPANPDNARETLSTALFLEAAYQCGRYYDMSADQIRPQSEVVSKRHFLRIYRAGFERTDGLADLEARAWIWRWINSRDLTIDKVIEQANN